MNLFSEGKLLFHTLTFSKFQVMETLQGLEIHRIQKYGPHRYADLNWVQKCFRFADYQGASKQILHGFYVHFTWILLNTVSLNEGFSMQKCQSNIPNYSASPVQKSKCSLWNQKSFK